MSQTDNDDKKAIGLQCQSTHVSEIVDDGEWGDSDVSTIGEEAISEITKGDEKPYFVEFIALYEGMSNNHRYYTSNAVKTCAEAMLNVNMYKGHIDPSKRSWQYREPVGRVVASKLSKVDLPDKKGVLCAKGKAYISEADLKLRTDISRKMAGNVSILGNAKIVRRPGKTRKEVAQINSLDSIDFCNPNTGGMKHAGVTAVVSEMSVDGNVADAPNTSNENQERKMTDRLTKSELSAQYPQEIIALSSELVDEKVAETRQEHEAKISEQVAESEAKIAEMQTEIDDLKKQNEDLQVELDKASGDKLVADLKVFAAEHVAEMKKPDGVNPDIVDMAAGEVDIENIDGDFDKSKDAYCKALQRSLDKLTKVAEMFGGNTDDGDGDNDSGQTKTKTHNTNRKSKDGFERFMSPQLVKSRKERLNIGS